MSTTPYLTTKELAVRIRRTPQAIRNMRHRGTAPKGVRMGREVLYLLADVTAWEAKKEAADPLAQRAIA